MQSAVEVSLAPGLQSLGFLGDENNKFRVRVQMDHTVFTGCKGATRHLSRIVTVGKLVNART
ncbi:hypothetical protein M404DRAFT_320514 [Pisolithus tinctorius Marx 270]|uniref:Uncharacterized protein n=1 Tax=Pisolithus tinctorius Marx 270 TaxID=870435 RepID=A0A0C3NIZ8_PISTI|nr:hypothetical protein M404DRAFT_320514 [Pisolithus tinctorius Marx 270]